MILLSLLACTPQDDGLWDSPSESWGDSDTPPTWSADVAPIFSEACISCHQDGGSGPFSLETYESAVAWADPIMLQTQARTMPPWLPDTSGDCQTFRDTRSLSDAQIATIAEWVGAGAPQGDAMVLEPPPPATLPEVDYEQDIGGEYTPATTADDDYRCFLFERGDDANGFLAGFHIEAQDSAQTHHATVVVVNDDASADIARARDADDDGIGWSCNVPLDLGTAVGIWHSGMPPVSFPEGTGVPLPEGTPFIVWAHFYVAGGSVADNITLRLDLEDTVAQEAVFPPLAVDTFTLEPGLAETSITLTSTASDMHIPDGATLLGIGPHMHARGVGITVVANVGTAEERCLLRTATWNYHHQEMFFYDPAPVILRDDEITLTCTFDTSGDTEPITSGSEYTQEMCLAASYAVAAGS